MGAREDEIEIRVHIAQINANLENIKLAVEEMKTINRDLYKRVNANSRSIAYFTGIFTVIQIVFATAMAWLWGMKK